MFNKYLGQTLIIDKTLISSHSFNLLEKKEILKPRTL